MGLTLADIRGYIPSTPAKSGVGIGVPDVKRRHQTRQRLFYCRKHGHIRIMVGCVGAEKSAPVPLTRLRQPCTVHHPSIGVVGGDYLS